MMWQRGNSAELLWIVSEPQVVLACPNELYDCSEFSVTPTAGGVDLVGRSDSIIVVQTEICVFAAFALI